jgi:hypothetical protein
METNERLILIQEAPRGASQVIELPITTGQGSNKFPDSPEIQSNAELKIVITGINLITPKVLGFGPITGTANTPLVDLRNLNLILYSDGWQKGVNIPVLTLNNVADSDATTATTIPFRNRSTKFDKWKIAWNKSTWQFSPGTVATATSVMLLEVEYIRYELDEKTGMWVELIGPQ